MFFKKSNVVLVNRRLNRSQEQNEVATNANAIEGCNRGHLSGTTELIPLLLTVLV